MKPEQRVKELGISLEEPPAPVANYVPTVRTGNLIFVSGQSCILNNLPVYTGKLGRELTLEEGYQAARIAALNCLAVIRKEVGSLDRVSRVVKLLGLVSNAPGFNEQPRVINGASGLMVEVFGEKGRHARSAVGTNELPFNIPVEVEMIVEISD